MTTGNGERQAPKSGSEFQRAMSDATPLEDRGEFRAPAKALRRRKRREGEDPRAFEIERLGERVEGRAPGVDASLLRKLRNGDFAVEARLDLHGQPSDTARRNLHATLERVYEEGKRCLLVIHGRGRGSESGPVLKQALPDWLAEPPSGSRVLAFCSARGRDGGVGATYVLLRRER